MNGSLSQLVAKLRNVLFEYDSSGDGWQSHQNLTTVRLENGETAAPGVVMRRKVDGRWHYRACTNAEFDRFVSDEAW